MFSGNLRDAMRSVHVSYPVPFIAALLIAGSLSVIGLARLFSAGERLILLGLGSALCLVALGVIIKAVFFAPVLLRSEKYVFLDRMMNVLGDDQMDAVVRERLNRQLIASWASTHPEGAPTPIADFGPGRDRKDDKS